MEALSRTEAIDFIHRYVEIVQSKANQSLPPFFLTAAGLLMKHTPFGSVMDFLNEAKSKRDKKN